MVFAQFLSLFQETMEPLDKIGSESLVSDLDPQSRLLLGIQNKEEEVVAGESASASGYRIIA